MNFIEIFRKYDKVVESFIGKTKSKTTRDIIGDADRYVSRDKEILHQLKEFVEQDGHEKYFGFSEDLPGQFYIEQQNDEGELEEWVIIELNLITSVEDGNMDVNLGEEGSYVEAFAVNKDYSYYVTVRWEELDIDTRNGILDYLNFTDLRYDQINESFTRKISRKKNDELISKSDTAFLPDGVYILHKTLGVRTVGGWNPKDNKGVVGILLIEDDHKIVVALEDAPEKLRWSKKPQSVNEPIGNYNLVQSDFNGEYYCQNLNSPDFPAAYYCLNYKKGNRSWYLPSAGELLMIYNHLEEIQSALEVVGGQKIVTDDDVREYLSSTEYSGSAVWFLHFVYGISIFNKDGIYRVRPVSAFHSSLKESFTRKIRSKKNDELKSKADTAFVPDGVYILHDTLGLKGVDGWNPRNNYGVVGVLVVEDEHQLVVALEDSPENLQWSKDCKLVNRPADSWKDAESDFNGEGYCRNLNSPDFPAAYYCLNYNKGGRDWYLPSMGELWLIRNHLEEVQTALSIVGGQRFVTEWDDNDENAPWYWSSTEYSAKFYTWVLLLDDRDFSFGGNKVGAAYKVRPVSNFRKKNTLKESFTKKISSKKNTDLISKPSFVPDGVYILHETLGVRTVNEWNPKNNKGVVGILLIEDDHKIVVALKDSPKNLCWSKKRKMVNQPVDELEDAQNDFNGEYYCQKLDSPDFPSVRYCKTYNKGGRSWYLPSSGELWLICRHLEEIQNALETVGGKKFATEWDNGVPCYWSSTEYGDTDAWYLTLASGYLSYGFNKVSNSLKVRPVFKFDFSTLKESFTKKIKKQSSKNVIDNADEDIKMTSPLTFEDDEVSNIFFNELVDVDDYEDNVYTLEDASIDSHEHDGYSEYFPFDDYQSNFWKDNNKIVKFNELRFFTGLKKLPEYAFVNCTSLEELILPENLEQIEQGAFANCISLKTVKMPKNRTLKFIEDSAFANTGLVSVVIPDGVEVIGECAFADCEYLESVVIPPSVKKIERGAFSRCRKLKSVSGIETVSEFGTDVFYGCGLLERLDSDVFGKFIIPRGFEITLFSADWIYDSNAVRERFLETYCLNHYDTEDYKHITEKEWEEDEFNPNSPNFDENRFDDCVWDYACDAVSWDWDDFKRLIINKFQGRGGWVCPEDGERFSDFSYAFEHCIPDKCDWGELEVKQDEGSLIVCGTEIVPLCDRYIDDEIDEIYPNEFIDYESLRFCDPIEKEISL